MKVNTITGTIKALGGLSLEGVTSRAISDGAYSEIVFQGESGQETVAKKVHAPARVNRLLKEQKSGTFIIAKLNPIIGTNRLYAARVDGQDTHALDLGTSYYIKLYTLYLSGLVLGFIMSFLLLGIPVFLYCLFMVFALPLRVAKLKKVVANSGFTLSKSQLI